mmetsp:Transcript_83658/g.223830  ORF Transcript_83658/g.223830 Transcript_83658/m.223830 type:complete len:215 (+) Transcript_83658:120-764(+)
MSILSIFQWSFFRCSTLKVRNVEQHLIACQGVKDRDLLQSFLEDSVELYKEQACEQQLCLIDEPIGFEQSLMPVVQCHDAPMARLPEPQSKLLRHRSKMGSSFLMSEFATEGTTGESLSPMATFVENGSHCAVQFAAQIFGLHRSIQLPRSAPRSQKPRWLFRSLPLTEEHGGSFLSLLSMAMQSLSHGIFEWITRRLPSLLLCPTLASKGGRS